MRSLLLRRRMMVRSKPVFTLAVNPSSASSNVVNAQNAYTDENSTTYANPRLATAGTERTWWFGFDTSALPADAQIVSVMCRAKAKLTGVTNVNPKRIYVVSGGTTQKGVDGTLTTADKTFTWSDVTWTREELSNVRVQVTAMISSGSAPWLWFYGATLTIKYTL